MCDINNRILFSKNLSSVNRNIRKRCEICSKLTLKTPERRRWHLFKKKKKRKKSQVLSQVFVATLPNRFQFYRKWNIRDSGTCLHFISVFVATKMRIRKVEQILNIPYLYEVIKMSQSQKPCVSFYFQFLLLAQRNVLGKVIQKCI